MNKEQIAQWKKDNLKEGEIWAGVILGTEGEADHHLILLPGKAASLNWDEAKAFASNAGGELPTRREQSLLYSNLKKEFKDDCYWSGEQHAGDSVYAWYQYFINGNQYIYYKYLKLRVRAVRRQFINSVIQ